jgi:hypothetical protein
MSRLLAAAERWTLAEALIRDMRSLGLLTEGEARRLRAEAMQALRREQWEREIYTAGRPVRRDLTLGREQNLLLPGMETFEP